MSKTAKDKALQAAIDEMAVLDPLPDKPSTYDFLIHMKAIEGILADVFEAGVKNGYAQQIIDSVNDVKYESGQ